MKIKALQILAIILGCTVVFSSCTKDDDNDDDSNLPTTVQADNNWLSDTGGDQEIKTGEEHWYKVVGESNFTTMYIEWAEADAHGESRTYTADIQVSAYQLDGVTPYFEDKDNGFGESIKSITLAGTEKDALIKVTLTDANKAGTFDLRATGTAFIELEYEDLEIGDTWTGGVLNADEIIGYKVKCEAGTKLYIIWAEADSPEGADAGYTADIYGSVFHKDAITPYIDLDKGKEFLNKNKSHIDEPKSIEVAADENNIRIHIGNTTPGTFAIKVVERID